jgi:hypothetical protein
MGIHRYKYALRSVTTTNSTTSLKNINDAAGKTNIAYNIDIGEVNALLRSS